MIPLYHKGNAIGRAMRFVSQLCVGLMFLYFAVACLCEGSWNGMFVSFLGLFFWALASQEARDYLRLLDDALEGWEKSIKLSVRMVDEMKR